MKVKRLTGVAVLCAALAAMAAHAADPAGSATGKKPNILFIMGDDIGWMQPSCYHRGLMVGETPNIDRIAREGAIFMGSGSRYGTTVLKVGQRAGSNGTSGLLPSLHGSAPLVWPCSARWCPPVACGTSRSYATLHPQPGLGGSCQS